MSKLIEDRRLRGIRNHLHIALELTKTLHETHPIPDEVHHYTSGILHALLHVDTIFGATESEPDHECSNNEPFESPAA